MEGEYENNFELYVNHISIASAWECLPKTCHIIISGYHLRSGLFWGSSSACSEYYQHQHLSRHMIISMAGGITSAVVRSNKSYDIIGGSRGIQSQQYLDPSMTGVRTPLIIQLKHKLKYKYESEHKLKYTWIIIQHKTTWFFLAWQKSFALVLLPSVGRY